MWMTSLSSPGPCIRFANIFWKLLRNIAMHRFVYTCCVDVRNWKLILKHWSGRCLDGNMRLISYGRFLPVFGLPRITSIACSRRVTGMFYAASVQNLIHVVYLLHLTRAVFKTQFTFHTRVPSIALLTMYSI